MDDVPLVQIIDCIKDLTDRLRCILFGEFSVFTNPVKQLTARGQLSDNVEFVLLLSALI